MRPAWQANCVAVYLVVHPAWRTPCPQPINHDNSRTVDSVRVQDACHQEQHSINGIVNKIGHLGTVSPQKELVSFKTEAKQAQVNIGLPLTSATCVHAGRGGVNARSGGLRLTYAPEGKLDMKGFKHNELLVSTSPSWQDQRLVCNLLLRNQSKALLCRVPL